jgi:hypothetical protein
MGDGLAHYSQKPWPDAKLAAPRSGAPHAPCEAHDPHHAPLAQLDRALASGAKGQRFESSRARQSARTGGIGQVRLLRMPWLAGHERRGSGTDGGDVDDHAVSTLASDYRTTKARLSRSSASQPVKWREQKGPPSCCIAPHSGRDEPPSDRSAAQIRDPVPTSSGQLRN